MEFMPEWMAIVFMALLGACVGSFLNVVIYRLPRNESIVSPPSHCTICDRLIGWYENIPVLSYLVLGGRCRTCKTPISPRYALVELITAVMFVAVYDAFYKSGMHSWFGDVQMDWPLFVAHLVLVAVLIACSAIDIEYYLIDVRITWFAMLVGVLAWMGLPAETLKTAAAMGTGAGPIFAGLVGAVLGCLVRHRWLLPKMETETVQEEQEDEIEETPAKRVSMVGPVLGLGVYAAVSVGLIVWAIVGMGGEMAFKSRGLAYLGWAFLTIIIGGIPRRASDEEIVEIIEQEKSSARATAVKEFFGLLPVILGFVLFLVLFGYLPGLRTLSEKVIGARVGPLMPLMGLSAALAGMLVASAFGWAVRILFTLGFGKEAMGVGDIYILAAIGAISGAFVAVVGFFVGSVIGVLGIVVLLLWKTSRALSYGPWIAIGALFCLLFYRPIVNQVKPAVDTLLQLKAM
jgi:leader peptidase (prepilin peptidase)/N-methyltransferase